MLSAKWWPFCSGFTLLNELRNWIILFYWQTLISWRLFWISFSTSLSSSTNWLWRLAIVDSSILTWARDLPSWWSVCSSSARPLANWNEINTASDAGNSLEYWNYWTHSSLGDFKWILESNIQTNFGNWWVRYLLWNCLQVIVIGLHW